MSPSNASGAAQPSRRFAINAVSSWIANGTRAVIQLALLPIMAWLLTPQDFGLYALAQPTVMFFAALADSGIVASLAREDENNTAAWSTAFWLLLITYSVTGLLVAGSGLILSVLVHRTELIALMCFLALAMPLIAVGSTADARIARRGDLTLHSITDIVAAVSSAAVGVFAAYRGWGAWSLALQYVSIYFIRAILLNYYAFERPAFVFNIRSLTHHAGVSTAILARRIGELLGRLSENSIFATVFGASALGHYTVAQQASRFSCDVFSNPINGALFAYSLNQGVGDVARTHTRVSYLLALILLPASILGAVSAPRLLPTILGEKWSEVAPMFQGIIVFYAFSAITNLNDPILVRNDRAWVFTIVTLISSLLRVCVILLGIWFTAVQIAWFVGLVFLAQALVTVVLVPKGLTEGLSGSWGALWCPIFASALCGLVASGILSMFPNSWAILPALLAGILVYLCVVISLSREKLTREIGLLLTITKK